MGLPDPPLRQDNKLDKLSCKHVFRRTIDERQNVGCRNFEWAFIYVYNKRRPLEPYETRRWMDMKCCSINLSSDITQIC